MAWSDPRFLLNLPAFLMHASPSRVVMSMIHPSWNSRCVESWTGWETQAYNYSPFTKSFIWSRDEQAGLRTGRGCIDQIFTPEQVLEHYYFPIQTIIVLSDIRAYFHSVNRSAQWHRLSRNGVPEKYASVFKKLHRHVSSQVGGYDQLLSALVISSGLRKGGPISHFPSAFS